MFLTRRNKFAGRPLAHFPLVELDGFLGIKIGYCDHCNEPVLLKKEDKDVIMAQLWKTEKVYKNIIKKLELKDSFKKRLIKWVIGKLGEKPIFDENLVYN